MILKGFVVMLIAFHVLGCFGVYSDVLGCVRMFWDVLDVSTWSPPEQAPLYSFGMFQVEYIQQ